MLLQESPSRFQRLFMTIFYHYKAMTVLRRCVPAVKHSVALFTDRSFNFQFFQYFFSRFIDILDTMFSSTLSPLISCSDHGIGPHIPCPSHTLSKIVPMWIVQISFICCLKSIIFSGERIFSIPNFCHHLLPQTRTYHFRFPSNSLL